MSSTTPHDTDPRRRKAELAAIHAKKKQLGLDDETYRDLVARISAETGARVESSARMTAVERRALIQEMERLGARFVPADRIFGESKEPHILKLFACAYQLIKDGAIAPSDPARWLRKFVKRLTGIADPRWLPAHECNQVIESLKAWHRRLDARAAQRKAERAAIAPSASVMKAAGRIMARLAEQNDPRTGARRFLAFLSEQRWTSTQTAQKVAHLIEFHGERAHIELAGWDYRAARKELMNLMAAVAELEPSIWDRLFTELGIEKEQPREGANIAEGKRRTEGQ